MKDLSAYLVGRKPGDWPAESSPATDMLFAAVRRDGETLEGMEFAHCTFANVSFKESTLRQCRFTDCVFVNCYFRRSKMIGVAFTGCRFLGCDFPRATVQSCDFRYSRFEGCAVVFAEMEHSLPREPNLREELAAGLAMAADALGLDAEGRRYRLSAIQAREEHLRAAVLSTSDWYQRHYSGLRRLQALAQLLGSRGNGLIWGHGEKSSVLIRNVLILAFVAFPAALWQARAGLVPQTGTLTVADVMWLSVTTMIPADGVTTLLATTWTTRTLLTAESFVGILAAGLLITQLVRRMLKR